MAERRRGRGAPVGLSAMLTILAVLCLTMLALLALSTVRVNGQMSRNAAQTVQDYYAADARANRILALLRAGQLPGGVEREGERYRYSCPISDRQELAVEVEVRGTDYRVLRWQAVSTGQWQAEDELPVWDGEEMNSD